MPLHDPCPYPSLPKCYRDRLIQYGHSPQKLKKVSFRVLRVLTLVSGSVQELVEDYRSSEIKINAANATSMNSPVHVYQCPADADDSRNSRNSSLPTYWSRTLVLPHPVPLRECIVNCENVSSTASPTTLLQDISVKLLFSR